MKIQSTKLYGNEAIEFANTFDHISPCDLELLMSWLDDRWYLTEESKKFRREFWKLFIKKR